MLRTEGPGTYRASKEVALDGPNFAMSFEIERDSVPDCLRVLFEMENVRFGIDLCESMHAVVAELKLASTWQPHNQPIMAYP